MNTLFMVPFRGNFSVNDVNDRISSIFEYTADACLTLFDQWYRVTHKRSTKFAHEAFVCGK